MSKSKKKQVCGQTLIQYCYNWFILINNIHQSSQHDNKLIQHDYVGLE